jgi:hypothetical protein
MLLEFYHIPPDRALSEVKEGWLRLYTLLKDSDYPPLGSHNLCEYYTQQNKPQNLRALFKSILFYQSGPWVIDAWVSLLMAIKKDYPLIFQK